MKELIIAILNPDYKAFVVYIVAFNINFEDNKVHTSRRAQITYLKVDKTLIKVTSKYVDFVNVISLNLAVELSEHISINNYAIELVNN